MEFEAAGFERDRLNVRQPHQCFENPAEPNVNLEVMLGLGENPDTNLHVTFVFKDGKQSAVPASWSRRASVPSQKSAIEVCSAVSEPGIRRWISGAGH